MAERRAELAEATDHETTLRLQRDRMQEDIRVARDRLANAASSQESHTLAETELRASTHLAVLVTGDLEAKSDLVVRLYPSPVRCARAAMRCLCAVAKCTPDCWPAVAAAGGCAKRAA